MIQRLRVTVMEKEGLALFFCVVLLQSGGVGHPSAKDNLKPKGK